MNKQAGVILAVIVGGWPMMASAQHSVGGRTASDAFADREADLASAACEGDVEGVQRAIQAGADPNSAGLNGAIVLNWAISCGDAEGVEALLDAGADPNRSNGLYTPMFQAAGESSPAVLATLLRHGGDPNARAGANSALSRALLRGNLTDQWENWRLLLAEGADPTMELGAPGHNVATAAIALARFDIVEELLQSGHAFDLQEIADLTAVLRVESVPEDQLEARQRVIGILRSQGITSTRRGSLE